jgi:hypothetical protein
MGGKGNYPKKKIKKSRGNEDIKGVLLQLLENVEDS